MTQLVFKNEISKPKLDALVEFLKVWDIEVEISNSNLHAILKNHEITIMSESALAKEWLSNEENNAWENL